MWSLVRKEFAYLRKFLLQMAFIFLAIIVIFGQRDPNMAAVYFRILPIVMSMTIPQAIFAYEERGNTFIFLRSLPLRPGQIVAVKYVFSVLLVAFFIDIVNCNSHLSLFWRQCSFQFSHRPCLPRPHCPIFGSIEPPAASCISRST